MFLLGEVEDNIYAIIARLRYRPANFEIVFLTSPAAAAEMQPVLWEVLVRGLRVGPLRYLDHVIPHDVVVDAWLYLPEDSTLTTSSPKHSHDS
jgi:hypothetical protein